MQNLTGRYRNQSIVFPMSSQLDTMNCTYPSAAVTLRSSKGVVRNSLGTANPRSNSEATRRNMILRRNLLSTQSLKIIMILLSQAQRCCCFLHFLHHISALKGFRFRIRLGLGLRGRFQSTTEQRQDELAWS